MLQAKAVEVKRHSSHLCSQDGYLKFLADNLSVNAISVGYRLAPEDPFPAGPEDCVDAAEYLLEHGEKHGGKLFFIGGEV